MSPEPARHDPWSTGPSVAQRLEQAPFRFDFFQAVRILERSGRGAVGGDGDPAVECVRFAALLSLVFPPSEIYDFQRPADEQAPPRMTVAFMGLTGPSGALPRVYTELLLERGRHKDRTLREFLDLFNHRLISLFFRAWEKHRFWLVHERCERTARRDFQDDPARERAFVTDLRPRIDRFGQMLLDLSGLGSPALRYRGGERRRLAPRTRIADLTLRYYSGLFAQQHRSAAGLEGLVADYFGVPAGIGQFISQWLVLEPDSQTRFVAGGNTQLGVSALAGERFWDAQSKFRVRLGPLGYADFAQFLPAGESHAELADLARLYSGPTFDVEVQLVLRGAEAPWCQLGGDGADAARLGWNTWIRNTEFTADVCDAIFALESGPLGTTPPPSPPATKTKPRSHSARGRG